MGYKLLLADDSITIQKVVTIIFANEECELTIVDNGNAALEKAGEVLPDIMLVDTLMPGTSGYEVCEKIRQDPALKSIPLLLLTGAFEPFDVDKAKESGADDFISKPFESQLLVEKVKSLVEVGKGRNVSAASPEPAVAAAFEPEKEAVDEPVQAAEEPTWTIDAPASPIASAVSISEETFSFQPETPTALVEEDVWATGAAAADSVPDLPVEEPAQGEEPADWVTSAYAIEETALTTGAASADAGTEAFPAVEAVSGDVFPSIEEVVDPVVEETVEVSPDDDLWGAFELEPVADDGRHDDVIETYIFEPDAASLTASVPSEESYAAPVDSGLGFPELASGWEANDAQELSAAPQGAGFEPGPVSAYAETSPFAADDFQEAANETAPSVAAVTQDASAVPADAAGAEDDSPLASSFFFSEEASVSPPAREAVQPEPASSFVEPVSASPVVPPVEAPAPETQPAPATAGIAVTEEQLEAMVARISREVIERIVWEVVPDLAEVLIKEEIRKIKEGR